MAALGGQAQQNLSLVEVETGQNFLADVEGLAMSIRATVLFGVPQQEIASLLRAQMGRAVGTRIITGFATPAGVEELAPALMARPSSLSSLVVGAATYPGFQALDALLDAGIPPDRLFVHLGHTALSGGHKNPFHRYHPMLHSKVYYMELPSMEACALIGSHNMTSFALNGLNGEAGVLLEGTRDLPEFVAVRAHCDEVQRQAIAYQRSMKEAYAWWGRAFIDGLQAEMRIPIAAVTRRTIVLFAEANRADMPRKGDQLYFEIPSGIEQIESLRTEVHLFLFDVLPSSPMEALNRTASAHASYLCATLGVENRQGNLEVRADWKIDGSTRPKLVPVAGGKMRPAPPSNMQQVHAEFTGNPVPPIDYLFEDDRPVWDPVLSDEKLQEPKHEKRDPLTEYRESRASWKLVIGLSPRQISRSREESEALRRASPDSGSFVLVSLRYRQRQSHANKTME